MPWPQGPESDEPLRLRSAGSGPLARHQRASPIEAPAKADSSCSALQAQSARNTPPVPSGRCTSRGPAPAARPPVCCNVIIAESGAAVTEAMAVIVCSSCAIFPCTASSCACNALICFPRSKSIFTNSNAANASTAVAAAKPSEKRNPHRIFRGPATSISPAAARSAFTFSISADFTCGRGAAGGAAKPSSACVAAPQRAAAGRPGSRADAPRTPAFLRRRARRAHRGPRSSGLACGPIIQYLPQRLHRGPHPGFDCAQWASRFWLRSRSVSFLQNRRAPVPAVARPASVSSAAVTLRANSARAASSSIFWPEAKVFA